MQLTYANLVTADATVNVPVLKAMVRQRALQQWGSTAPRYLRMEFYGHFRTIVRGLIDRQRAVLGLPPLVETVPMSIAGWSGDGVCREA